MTGDARGIRGIPVRASEHDGVEFDMSKPEKLYIDGKDYFLWPYEEQTQMKHKVVTDYFKLCRATITFNKIVK